MRTEGQTGGERGNSAMGQDWGQREGLGAERWGGNKGRERMRGQRWERSRRGIRRQELGLGNRTDGDG